MIEDTKQRTVPDLGVVLSGLPSYKDGGTFAEIKSATNLILTRDLQLSSSWVE